MIDPTLSAVLRSRYIIRRFFITYTIDFLFTLILFFMIMTFLPGNFLTDVLLSFLTTLSATIALFIMTYGFYIYVTPPGLRNAQVIPLLSGEILEEIVDLPKDTANYWFWGRSGSYFRSSVLLRLDKISSHQRRHITMRIVLPDPSKDDNSTIYRKIKESLKESADDMTLLVSVTSTILHVSYLTSRNPYLHSACPSSYKLEQSAA
jgi:hypothetical protein